MHCKPIALACLLAAAAYSQTPHSSFVAGTPADEAVIRSIVANDSADRPDPHQAADLDWENAFGIRYFDLKKRDAFYSSIVKPQFKDATDSSLEVKVRFIEPTVAVADEYWHVAGQVYAGETKPGPDRWGRTTYIFKKENGEWKEVMERVADLRLAYYKHYDALPAAVPVAAATLASYAGSYETVPGKKLVGVSVTGDHLTIQFPRSHSPFTAIPTSPTTFLVFDPDDLAEYYKATFTQDASGKTILTASRMVGDPILTATKVQAAP